MSYWKNFYESFRIKNIFANGRVLHVLLLSRFRTLLWTLLTMSGVNVSEEVGFLSRSAPLFSTTLQAQSFALRKSIRCELAELSC